MSIVVGGRSYRIAATGTAKVFSLNVKTQFLDYLRYIRDGISAEHVQAIREVYGDDHLEGVPSAQDKS